MKDAISNSPLVVYTKLSPNRTSPRNHVIDTVTVHVMACNATVESCGAGFANPSRQASSNYGIGTDGRIALYVEEKNASWCSSNGQNDHRAVTIEVANDGGAETGWHVSDKAYASLLDLLTDICKRNDIKKLLWQGNKNLIGQVEKQNMTVHRWFAAKACPGDYLYNKHTEIAEEVNRRLEDDDMVRYNTLNDIPNDYDFRDIINTLMDAQIIKGDGSDTGGNGDVIDLSHDQVRSLVFEYRGGAFDRKLIEMGMAPAVNT